MGAIFAFKCRCCGEVHEGSPSLAFRAPDQYASLSEEQKRQVGTLTQDLCTITHEGGTDRFIRAVIEVPIHGVEEPFLWETIRSLSIKSMASPVRERKSLPSEPCMRPNRLLNFVRASADSRTGGC